MRLTDEQVARFHTEGWLFLPEAFTPEEVAVLRTEAERIYRENRPEIWREKSGAPRTAFAAHTYNEAFRIGSVKNLGQAACPSLAGRHRLRRLHLAPARLRLQRHRPLRHAHPRGQAPACPRFPGTPANVASSPQRP